MENFQHYLTTRSPRKRLLVSLGAHFPPFVRLCSLPTLPHTHTSIAFHLRKKRRRKKLCLYLPEYSFLFALLFGSAIRCYFLVFQFCTQNGGRIRVCLCMCVFCSFHLFSLLAGFSPSSHLFPSRSDGRRRFKSCRGAK